MMRSLGSGVSGLRNHQVKMDVIANNIANVNTTAFKCGRVNFQEILSQNIRGNSMSNIGVEAVNPAQIGLGVAVQAIDMLFSQGPPVTTNRAMDMCIDGNGFFRLAAGEFERVNGEDNGEEINFNAHDYFYTRDGSFYVNDEGYLVNAAGLHVLGAMSQVVEEKYGSGGPTGLFKEIKEGFSNESLGSIHLDSVVSDGVVFNYTDGGKDNTKYRAEFIIPPGVNDFTITYKGKDDKETVLRIFHTGHGEWESETVGGEGTDGPGTAVPIEFDSGQPIRIFDPADSDENRTPGLDDNLTTIRIDPDGLVYVNGRAGATAQVLLDNYANPENLAKLGANLYEVPLDGNREPMSDGWGAPASDGGQGKLISGALEMSNVDLSTEFAEMIKTQRGYQANARVITVSDEMLGELINLKR